MNTAPNMPAPHHRHARATALSHASHAPALRCLLAAASVLALTGCTPFAETFTADISAPAAFISAPASTMAVDTHWWQSFADPALTALIDKAAANNHDIRIAVTRIRQARALRTDAAAAYYPQVTVSADATRRRLSSDDRIPGRDRYEGDFGAALDASWELDLFGRTGFAVQSAEADIETRIAEQRAAVNAVLSETASTYFEARGIERRILILQQNIALLGDTEKLTDARLQGGIVSQLDLARVRGERERLAATLPTLQSDFAAAIFRLSVLTGETPQNPATFLPPAAEGIFYPADIPAGLPSDLLTRRPDVAAAQSALAAATADVNFAKADMFPRLSLTGVIGTAAGTLSGALAPSALAAAASVGLDWTAFDGWRRSAEITRARALAEEQTLTLESTALRALEDAERTLTAYESARRRLADLRAAETTLLEAYRVAKLRFEAGEEDSLAMIDAERTLVSVRDDIAVAQTAVLTAAVAVHDALGGGWQSVPRTEN